MRLFEVPVTAIVYDVIEVDAETAEDAAAMAEALFAEQLQSLHLSAEEICADEPETHWQDGDPLTPGDIAKRYADDVGIPLYGPI